MAEDLVDLKSKIPYYKNLGISYIHLMAVHLSPEGENDGGYAVSDYRTASPDSGTIEHQTSLADAAKQELEEFQDYYFMFDDRVISDKYEQNLREIFPQVRRGSFKYYEDFNKWVWTTFNSFQWDLNYSNPEVFTAIS